MINVQIFDLPLLEPSSHLILIGTTSLGGPGMVMMSLSQGQACVWIGV